MNEPSLQFTMRLRLYRSDFFFGPGVEELFTRIEQTGSIQRAAAGMEMSYSKALRMIRQFEQEMGVSAVQRHTGGIGGGHSSLTPAGKAFLQQYIAFKQAVYEAADALFPQYFGPANVHAITGGEDE